MSLPGHKVNFSQNEKNLFVSTNFISYTGCLFSNTYKSESVEALDLSNDK